MNTTTQQKQPAAKAALHLTESDLARICHEVNRAYCAALGDASQVPWAQTPEETKASAVSGVRFRLNNPGAGVEAQHFNWLKEKQAAGWVPGDEKDAKKKTHPCCVPWNQLPPEQRAKDALFTAVVQYLEPLIVVEEKA